MISLIELKTKGFIVLFSNASPVSSWGYWFVCLTNSEGYRVTGYGLDEERAFDNALQIVQNRALTKL